MSRILFCRIPGGLWWFLWILRLNELSVLFTWMFALRKQIPPPSGYTPLAVQRLQQLFPKSLILVSLDTGLKVWHMVPGRGEMVIKININLNFNGKKIRINRKYVKEEHKNNRYPRKKLTSCLLTTVWNGILDKCSRRKNPPPMRYQQS